jgi:predicted MPP superfamily phosphohydrolase/uncharacterized membrane protein
MHRPLIPMLTFLAVALLLIGGTHYWFWTRFVRATDLQAPWRQLTTGLLVLGGLLLPLGLVLGRLVDAPWSRAVAFASYVWMGLVFLLLVGLGVAELLHLGTRLTPGVPDPERRLFLARLFGGGAASVAALTGAVALRSGLREPELVEVTVPLRRLPQALDGLTIVQISDLHVGPTIRGDMVAALVARVNALQPDVVAITGDLVDGEVSALREQTAHLSKLKAKHGVYFVTGNHEYYSGADQWLAELRSLGIRPLRNERVRIGSVDVGLDLAGIDDSSAHRFGGDHGADLDKAVRGRDPGQELVLLAHQPRHIDEAVAAGVGLQLSGHTHGGQIWPFNYLVKLAQPFVAGLGQRAGTWIYVSRGTGYWGPPMRLAAPSELTRVTLRAMVA